MARVGQDKIEEVRSRADIVEIVGAHVRLKRAGRNFVGLCPFHNEKTPSFTVNAERGFFHCFGCGAGGTAFDFVMRIEGLTFPEALQSLARRYGITLPERGEGAGVAAGERDAWFLANQTAAEFFAHVLWNTEDGKPARDYLKSRGITTDTARAFMLGFAPARPANLASALQKRGLMEAAVKLGLVRRDGANVHDMFRARLMFPIRDAQGRVIAFGGRVLDDRLPKYMNSTESPVYSKARALYGIYEARQTLARADRALVVEGYIDAIALWQAGFKETVASLGTSLTVDQLRLLSRYTRNVIACFDGDDAGRKASLRALEVFLAAGLLGKGAFIPAGFDPDTLVRDRGAQALQELLENAELLVDFFVEEEQRAITGPLGPTDQRVEAARRVADKLRLISDEFQFNLVVRKAAGMLGVGEELLRNYARRGGRPATAQTAASPREVARPARPDAATQAELMLLAIALLHVDRRAKILAAQPFDLFEDQNVAALLRDVCQREDDSTSLTAFVAQQLPLEQMNHLSAQIVAIGDPLVEKRVLEDIDVNRVIDDCLTILQRRKESPAEKVRRTATTSGSANALIELQQRLSEGR